MIIASLTLVTVYNTSPKPYFMVWSQPDFKLVRADIFPLFKVLGFFV